MQERQLPKCVRCSGPIEQGDVGVYGDGNWIHVTCWQIETAADNVRTSREMTRRSRTTIAKSQERIERYRHPAEPPAVLCVICRTGIVSLAELATTPSGPMHGCCRPPAIKLKGA